MKMSVLALSMSAITGTIYAEDQVQQPQVEGAQSSGFTDAPSSSSATTDASTQTSSVADANSVAPAANTDAHQAASALQKKEGDASPIGSFKFSWFISVGLLDLSSTKLNFRKFLWL